MTAKEYLRQIEQKRRLIERGRERLKELGALTATVKGISYDLDRVQSCNHDGMAGVEKLVDMELKIRAQIIEYTELSQRIIEQVNAMEDRQSSEVLYLRYIVCMRWEQIACKMNIGLRGLYKAHGRALAQFAEKYKEFI